MIALSSKYASVHNQQLDEFGQEAAQREKVKALVNKGADVNQAATSSTTASSTTTFKYNGSTFILDYKDSTVTLDYKDSTIPLTVILNYKDLTLAESCNEIVRNVISAYPKANSRMVARACLLKIDECSNMIKNDKELYDNVAKMFDGVEANKHRPSPEETIMLSLRGDFYR